MSPEKIKAMIQAQIEDAQVVMSGEDCNFVIEVISPVFAGKTPLQCHRLVNDIFKADLESGALHALSIKTRLPESL